MFQSTRALLDRIVASRIPDQAPRSEAGTNGRVKDGARPKVAPDTHRLRKRSGGTRFSGWILAVVIASVLAPSKAASGEPQIEYNAFKRLFTEQVGGAIDGQIEDAESELRSPGISQARRLEIEAELSELRALERQVGDVAMIESLYGSVKGGFEAISDLAEEMESGYSGESSVNAALAGLAELGGTDRLKQLSAASRGVDSGLKYFDMIRSLQQDLASLDSAELSPSTRRLASQLTVMTSIMSNFGDKVPLIGSFIEAYGDVGGGLVEAAVALDAPIRELEQGELRPGVHGLDRGEMLDKLWELDGSIEGASAVGGLRDAYKTDCGKFVLWDRDAREFVLADEDGLDESELRRRYLFYAEQGVENPSPDKIVRVFRRTLILELTPSKTHIEGGESITLTASARRAVDDQQVSSAYVDIRVDRHPTLRPGTFEGPTEVKVGTPVRWTAPGGENLDFTFVAKLAGASSVFETVEPASARVRTGAATKISLTGSPLRVGPGDEVELVARVLRADGSPVDADASGHIGFREQTGEGYFIGHQRLSDGKGLERTWMAPSEPGRYTIIATYEGATSYSLFGRHLAASEASIGIEVTPPAWSLKVDPTSATATPDSPATFRVRLINGDEKPRRFELTGRLSPDSQRPHWTAESDHSRRVKVEGRDEHVVNVSMTPRNEDATRLGATFAVRPRGTLEVREVSMSASATSTERKVSVTARGENSRPSTRGETSWSGSVAPGEEIPLGFRPWGPQREFCVTEVVERNRNMRQVRVNNHGPGGCSWGTVDGRMSAAWSVDSEEVNWSGSGVKGSGTSAAFVVPDEPGRYTVNARGVTKWSYVRRTPGGTVRDDATDRSSAVYTIVVE